MTAVLIYRTLGLGDFLTAVPAYRAVANAFPAARLVLAAPEPLRPLAALTGAVGELLPTGELQPPRWAGPPPDVAVNLHGRGPQSHQLLQALSSQRLVAFGSEQAGVAGPAWSREEHEVVRWCRMLDESGIPADPADLTLDPPQQNPVVEGATLVHPGAAAHVRRWPADRFARVAAELDARGHHIVVTGNTAEVDIATTVAVGAGLPVERVLAGGLDLGGLAALVAAARLVVCGDTGVGHLATAYRTPSVLLFGPVSPDAWGPPADRRQEHHVLWHRHLARPGAPHDAVHPALMAISVDEVLAAVDDVDDAVKQRSSPR